MAKNIVTGLLILSVVAFLYMVGRLFFSFTFEGVSYATISFLVVVGFATLEQHLDGVTSWNSGS